MADTILNEVRAGKTVCAALYGHPGIFACVGHIAITDARAEGFSAEMLPGISTEDCLVADLGIDPGTTGMQSMEAHAVPYLRAQDRSDGHADPVAAVHCRRTHTQAL